MPEIYLLPTALSDDHISFFDCDYYHDIIDQADEFWVENLRTARRFLSAIRCRRKIQTLTFKELSKKTPQEEIRKWCATSSGTVIVMSEAGCPGIADPGAVAIDYAHKASWKVIPLAGPSSILMALMASGMNGQRFEFHGYLPVDKKQQAQSLKSLENDSKKHHGKSQIFMETPYRNNQLLRAVLATCSPETKLCVAANLTSKEENIRSMKLAEWKKHSFDYHKQPAIFVMNTN